MDAYIGLGSNVGERWDTLVSAIAALERHGLKISAASSVWETEPIDSPEPLWFLNMVVKSETSRAPRDVLDTLLAIERDHGRERSVKNAPRTLDLDLLLYGDVVLDEPRLVLPHPRMWERAFVLEPLAEIAPTLRDPRGGPTVDEARHAVAGRHAVRAIGRLDRAGGHPV